MSSFFFLSSSNSQFYILFICNSYMNRSTRFIYLKCVLIPYFILYFCLAKFMDFLTLKCYTSFQYQNNRKGTHSFAPKSLIFKLQLEVLKFSDICVSWSSPKTGLEAKFINLQNRNFEIF